MIDLYDFAVLVSDKYPSEANSLKQAIENLVIYNKTSDYISDANGVSIYFPFDNKESISRRVPIYSEIDFAPTYKQLVIDFSEQLTGKNFNKYNFAEFTPVEQKNGEIELYFTNDQLDNISDIYFTLWQQVKEEHDYYIQIARDSNVEIEDDGRISTTFDGVWKTIEGQWICMYEIENAKGYKKYSCPVMLNGIKCDMIVLFNSSNQNGKIMGFVPINDNTHMASKNLIQIKNGDKSKFSYYAELFLSKEQLESDTRPSTKTFFSKEITVKNSLSLKDTNATEGVYLYGFEVYDTQKEKYFTEFIKVDFN